MPTKVGIDLGTTFSAVACIDPESGLPKVIPNSEGNHITPSVILFRNGKPIFGSVAESAFNAGEANTVATFKRSMGKDEDYCYIDGKGYTSTELSALLLRHLKEDAEAELGDTISEAVITVPAYFYSTEREATVQAAQMAGLKVKKIIDEPNASIMAYGLKFWRENANILVYDLGGGTFDVTLSHMGKNGNIQTIVTRGDHYLGGRDWDDRLENLLISKFETETGLEIQNDEESQRTIRGLSEGVKKQLSKMQSVTVRATFSFYGQASVTVSRQEFDDVTRDLIERTGALCDAVLKEAGIKWRDVTNTLLVGGSTRMPQVSEYLTELSGKKPITHVNPDEAVALGAAIQVSKEIEGYSHLSVITTDGKKQTDRKGLTGLMRQSAKPAQKLNGIGVISLQETTAHAMGIIAVSEDGTHYINDTIIPANHPRPVKAAKAYYTKTDRNTDSEMEIFVLQGDHENPLENQIPFRYVVSGIRSIPKSHGITRIRIQYSYDNNGIIHVQARQEDDNYDLPIRREAMPKDMSKFVQPISEGTSIQLQNHKPTTGLGLYNEYAGISNIPTTSLDRFGNPEGSEYDLAADGSFDGYTILILNLCTEATMYGAEKALKKKGFSVNIITGIVPDHSELKKLLSGSSQLWIISQQILHFDEKHYKIINDFFNSGHGIYIWGDNDPLNTDANFLIKKLFNSNLSGDYLAMKVLGIQEGPNEPGIIENHLISTGIVSFFEGDSIAKVKIDGGLEPLIYSSDKNIVTAYYDRMGKRALVDGAFTRLWDTSWGTSAGTERYIVNAAAWLVNLERFEDTNQQTSKTVQDETINDQDRDVPTW